MVGDGRDWLAAQPLPDTARQQITVALAMIDALEVQIAPLDRELRSYARAQTGCKALIDAYHGIGELCAVTIVSELGDCRRFSNSRAAAMPFATAGWNPIATAHQGTRQLECNAHDRIVAFAMVRPESRGRANAVVPATATRRRRSCHVCGGSCRERGFAGRASTGQAKQGPLPAAVEATTSLG
jgi:transposase